MDFVKIIIIIFISILIAVNSICEGYILLKDIIKNFEKEYKLTFNVPEISKHEEVFVYNKKPELKMDLIQEQISHAILQISHDIGVEESKRKQQNINIFSPISLISILYLLFMGSNGKTFEEFKNVLGLNGPKFATTSQYEIHKQFGLLLHQIVTDSNNLRNPKVFESFKYTFNNKQRKQQKIYHPLYKLQLASGIFFKRGLNLRPTYTDTVAAIYKSTIVGLDFNSKNGYAARYINSWVKDKTNGKIQEIITGRLRPTTEMITVSTLYFNALWKTPFVSDITTRKNFYPQGIHGKPKFIEMMVNVGSFPYYDSTEFDCRILGLPYKGDEITMYIILPNQSNDIKIRQLQSTLNANKLEELISKTHSTNIAVSFPKLYIKNSFDFKATLKNIGLSSLFNQKESDLSLIATQTEKIKKSQQTSKVIFPKSSSQETTNFHRFYNLNYRRFYMERQRNKRNLLNNNDNQIDNLRQQNLINPGLYLDNIIHKIDLTIEENGTEGAASTSGFISRFDSKYVFLVDSPFLILIRHEATKLPLFYGYIIDPSK